MGELIFDIDILQVPTNPPATKCEGQATQCSFILIQALPLLCYRKLLISSALCSSSPVVSVLPLLYVNTHCIVKAYAPHMSRRDVHVCHWQRCKEEICMLPSPSTTTGTLTTEILWRTKLCPVPAASESSVCSWPGAYHIIQISIHPASPHPSVDLYLTTTCKRNYVVTWCSV